MLPPIVKDLPDLVATLLERAAGWIRGHHAGHWYLSTSCMHGQHGHCRSTVNTDGDPKRPGTCKWCPARCVCTCHPAT